MLSHGGMHEHHSVRAIAELILNSKGAETEQYQTHTVDGFLMIFGEA